MPDQPQAKNKNNFKNKGILATIGALILTKLKSIFALLKLFKFGGTFISLFISLGAYAIFFGWTFAVVLIYLLFVHEMGHLIAAKQKGLKTSPAVFVPFMGAVIGLKEQPKDAKMEAYIAYAGPLAGLISIIPGVVMYYFDGGLIWALVIFLGSMLNLFNLFPVSPLDGGRVVGLLSTKLWFVGLIGIAVYFYFTKSPLILLILVFGLFNWWHRVRDNYRLRRLKLSEKALEDRRELLKELRNDLFYQHSFHDEDGPIRNEGMIFYLVRHYRTKAQSIEDELAPVNEKWYIPFFQDDKKLAREQLREEKQKYINMIQAVQAIEDDEQWQSQMSSLLKQLQNIREEQQTMETYYEADTKTKWKVFIAYILLAIILSTTLYYSQMILDSIRGYSQFM
ncbi:site-2 protease family protein [Tuberibacillus sp. Marseille-P3662]|uniref:site-2 protease family protein n=1 Tax=Tuberibacillus sp. Marseille-P3662 TaxID=1965358 RepID=UPI000A1CE71E|nr:site-2 protease family protein [Tuberibacillus sp. Marseille-P3662]